MKRLHELGPKLGQCCPGFKPWLVNRTFNNRIINGTQIPDCTLDGKNKDLDHISDTQKNLVSGIFGHLIKRKKLYFGAEIQKTSCPDLGQIQISDITMYMYVVGLKLCITVDV